MGATANLLPVIVLLTVVGIAAFVGYQIYLWSNDMADRGKRHLDKKHVSFSKDGMKVGVKQIDEDEYADKTQSYLVKAWNFSSFPAYRSRLGWNPQADAGPASTAAASATSSKSSTKSASSAKPNSASTTNLNAPPTTRSRAARAPSPSPGAFPQ